MAPRVNYQFPWDKGVRIFINSEKPTNHTEFYLVLSLFSLSYFEKNFLKTLFVLKRREGGKEEGTKKEREEKREGEGERKRERYFHQLVHFPVSTTARVITRAGYKNLT